MTTLTFGAPDLPDGARWRSLRGASGEWLHPATGERTLSSFTSSSLGGWDEMLPTITACRVPHDAGFDDWSDHGDAWNRPWEGDADDHWVDVAWMRLRRRITSRDASLHLSYTLSSTAPEARPVQWVAHPQFSWEPGMTLDVGRAGTWRRTHPAEKVQRFGANLDPGSLLESADGAKWWSTAPIDRVVLRRSDGSGLEVRWDGTALPCVALWLDPGAYASSPVIAIEPALAPFDSLADAASAAAASTVSRSHPLSWWIRLREIGAPASSDSVRPTGDANHRRATG